MIHKNAALQTPAYRNGECVTNGGLPNVQIDWNQLAESIVTKGLEQVPEIGGILGDLVGLLWPKEKKVDPWDQVKQQTEDMINAKISQQVYEDVQNALGVAENNSGLIGVLNDYERARQDDKSVETHWVSANIAFIDDSAKFERASYEILLLPLFAQMANLHLVLLRDGVLQQFCTAAYMQEKLKIYSGWANTWMTTAVKNQSAQTPGQFNSINKIKRFMQVNVGDIARLWTYLDPIAYPNPVHDLPAGPEIFYTITEQMPFANTRNYAPPITPAAYITDIKMYSLNVEDHSKYIPIFGATVAYDRGVGVTPYSGCSNNPGPRPPQTDTSTYAIGTYSAVDVAITDPAGNPITSVNGVFSANGYISMINFHLKSGISTGAIPRQQSSNHDSTYSYSIIPPVGYYLSSLWVSQNTTFYNSPLDIVFGWRNGTPVAN